MFQYIDNKEDCVRSNEVPVKTNVQNPFDVIDSKLSHAGLSHDRLVIITTGGVQMRK